MNKLLLGSIIFVFLLTSNLVQAGLLEEVDKLSEKEAYLLITKLEAKMFKPMPESFFTRIAFIASAGGLNADADDFKNSLNFKHNVGDRFDDLYAIQASILWRICDAWYLGLGAGQFGRRSNQEIVASLYEKVYLKGTYLHIQNAYKIPISKSSFLFPMVGFGAIQGVGFSQSSNDLAQTSFENYYTGKKFSFAGSVSWIFQLNELIGLGLEGGYHHAKIKKLKRSGITEISNPDTLDFSGAFAGLKLSVNL